MMKCDYCYDRTSAGKRPMCATVCPSQALSFTTHPEIERTRRGTAVNEWKFGEEVVRTKVYLMMPSPGRTVNADLVPLRRREAAADDVAALLEGA
jgi:Fe-S-cluster-containing dehydrogenase component